MRPAKHQLHLIAILAAAALLAGCSKPEYDASSPQAALDSMYQMIADGRPESLGGMIHIDARDIAFDDGVTEASAIGDVTEKAGQMLGQLFRVAKKLRERYPDQVRKEVAKADAALSKSSKPGDEFDFIARFMADPFGLMDQNRSRVTVEDLGDGTAAVLVDGKPVFGVGLTMKEVDGRWKIDIPIDLLQAYRPNTREEWTVLAKMMLSIENALSAFETELDAGQFRDLSQASARAGRLLGERMAVQVLIYQVMKKSSPKPAATSPASTMPAAARFAG